MGFFSWKCAKSGKSISNKHSIKGATPCVLVTPFENFIEENYEGYGRIGVDVYAMLAFQNEVLDVKDLDEFLDKLQSDKFADEASFIGIELREVEKPIKIVALEYYNGESYDEIKGQSELCPYQGYFYDDEDDF